MIWKEWIINTDQNRKPPPDKASPVGALLELDFFAFYRSFDAQVVHVLL